MDGIGFIGTGHVGAQIARAVVAVGYDVVLSNARGPYSLEPLVGEFGGRARSAGTPHRRALAIAGDDAAAKKTVAAIYDEVGFDTLDLGVLDEAWRVDRGQPAFIAHLDLPELIAYVARADRSRSGR